MDSGKIELQAHRSRANQRAIRELLKRQVAQENTNIEASAAIIKSHMPEAPKIAIISGSGMAEMGKSLFGSHQYTTIPYEKLAGWPNLTVKGHSAVLMVGHIDGVPTLIAAGRKHLYEGEGATGMRTIIRTFRALSTDVLISTSAVGSLDNQYDRGSLVLVEDHIGANGHDPLIGPHNDKWGEPFTKLAGAWTASVRQNLQAVAKRKRIALPEGLFFWKVGRSFETPAEIADCVARAFNIGYGGKANIVGMSLAPEGIIAAHCGLKIAGLGVVTNLGEGIKAKGSSSVAALTHEHTLEGAQLAMSNLLELLSGYIRTFKK